MPLRFPKTARIPAIIGICIIGIVGVWLNTDDWQTFTDAAKGISFRYPAQLPTTYITAHEWPPVVEIQQRSAYPCPVGARDIAGKYSYCVQTRVGAAAGSMYTTYTYSTGSLAPGTRTTITFTLRAPQCQNFDESLWSVCEEEQASFDLDGLVDRIAHSIERSE